MKRYSFIVVVFAVLMVFIGACQDGPSTTESSDAVPADGTSAKIPAVPAQTGATATTLAPEAMPTAKPLWTATAASPNQPPVPAPDAPAPQLDTEAPPLDPTTVAVVNGVAISRQDYDTQIAQAQTHFVRQPGLDLASPQGQEALRTLERQVLSWMIDQILIEQTAASLGIRISDEKLDQDIAKMRDPNVARFDQWLASNGLTPESLRDQMRMDMVTAAIRDKVTSEVPRKAPQVHVRHILTSNREAAQAALDELANGGDFIALVTKYSEDPTTRDGGGDLGFMPRGIMSPVFENAAFALQPGETSGLVRTEFGFHIIQMVEIDQNRPIPDELWPALQQRAFEAWLAEQRSQATIVSQEGMPD